MFEIEFSEGAAGDLAELRAFDRKAVLDAVSRQLRHEPTKEARQRKLLPGLVPPFDAEPPIWQLRIGDFRVFCDVDTASAKVVVLAVRKKPPEKTTEEIP